jgi:hypothetical protein
LLLEAQLADSDVFLLLLRSYGGGFSENDTDVQKMITVKLCS